MGTLILVRHGISEWNKLGEWTGWTDVELAPEGYEDATRAGDALKDIHIDVAYSSNQKRAFQTLKTLLAEKNQPDLNITQTSALIERNYGDYTGKNKWEVKEQLGEDRFHQLRRGWEYPIPNGETMKDVYGRVVPFYQQEVLPLLQSGQTVILAASGNSLRALVKYLENLSNDELAELEIGLGEIHMYSVTEDGRISNKQIRAEREDKGKI